MSCGAVTDPDLSNVRGTLSIRTIGVSNDDAIRWRLIFAGAEGFCEESVTVISMEYSPELVEPSTRVGLCSKRCTPS